MKRWWQHTVKNYLTFTARERIGLFVMALFGIGFYLFSHYYPVNKRTIRNDDFQQELAELKISIDTSRGSNDFRRDDNFADLYRPKQYANDAPFRGELFAFDPNTLSADGWKKLGVRDKTVNTIQNFIAKGYKFRKPDDLRKIYGLKPQDADRLIPYVRIAGKADQPVVAFAANNSTYKNTAAPEPSPIKIIDINTADTAAFIALPGIGNKLAARIIKFREKLGGFSSVAQVAETFGLPDSTFQQIKPRLQPNNSVVKKININTADANELKNHPYFKWNIANAIVNYRLQHGNYKSLDDLHKIEIIDDELFNKIAPYLIF